MKYRVFLLLTLLALLVSIAPLAAQDATECETGFRLIEHVAGTDCIPETVERVVIFDTGATELLLALNRPPVLRSAFLESFQLAVLPELADEFTALTGDLPDMGFPINLEVLLEADPDVIITNADFAELFPENIETIAPLVVLGREWKSKLVKTAEVIGEVEATEALLASYESRVEIPAYTASC
jgi:iron complex transport system substrate-binding protein